MIAGLSSVDISQHMEPSTKTVINGQWSTPVSFAVRYLHLVKRGQDENLYLINNETI